MKTATTVRYEQALAEIAYRRLAEFRHLQAEAIAKHYAAHATLALNLLHLIEASRVCGDPEALDQAIEFHVNEIKTNHRHDLGIALEWVIP